MKIIAYTYDGEAHCVPCTQAHQAAGGFNLIGVLPGSDEHGIVTDAEDREGNAVNRVYYSNADGFRMPSPDADKPELCADCREPISIHQH